MAKLLVGKTVTLSFRVKKGANWSDADGTMSARVAYNDNTDGNVITQAATTALSNTFTPTTSFATYSVTGTIPSSGVSTLMINFMWEPTGTAGADDWLEFSAVQLEIGSVATPFSRAGGDISGELAACQRYYAKSYNIDTAPATSTGVGQVGWTVVSTGANANLFYSKFPVTMRANPTVTIYSPLNGQVGTVCNNSIGQNKLTSAIDVGTNGFVFYVTDAPGGAVGYYLGGHYAAQIEL